MKDNNFIEEAGEFSQKDWNRLGKKNKKNKRKAFYCEIPVAPEDVERFKKACEHYEMTVTHKRGAPYFTVGTDNIADLYWLGANIFGNIETIALTIPRF